MLAAVQLATEEASAVVTELPIHPIMYGVLAFGALMALLLVTYAFRSVWTRH